MAEADNLQRFTVSSATASNMILGGVGTDACSTAPPIWSSCRSAPVSPAHPAVGYRCRQLRSVSVRGRGHGDHHSGERRDRFHDRSGRHRPRTDLNVSVGPEARNDVRADADGANWLQAASIGTMTINSVGNSVAGTVDFTTDMDNLGDIELDVSDLIGLDFQSQQAGSRISISGSALVTGLYFHDEVVTDDRRFGADQQGDPWKRQFRYSDQRRQQCGRPGR
jgi:hypothetical protein